jgi:hypothetical protein
LGILTTIIPFFFRIFSKIRNTELSKTTELRNTESVTSLVWRGNYNMGQDGLRPGINVNVLQN